MTATATYGNSVNNTFSGGNDPHSNNNNNNTTSNTLNMAHQNSMTPPAPPTSYNSSHDSGIELTENFFINNNHKTKHNLKIQVQLNATGIYLRRETDEHDQVTEQLIRMEDIIGSHCGGKLKKRVKGGLNSCKRLHEDDDEKQQHQNEQLAGQDSKDVSAYLYIYAYVRKEKPLRRMRTVRILRFRSFLTYDDNLKTAERWQKAIKVNKGLDLDFKDKKPLLILLNPKSGSGKGRVMFQKQVVPILKEAEVQYELVVTTHANFARELVKKRQDLAQKYRGIVVASGDGLFYEVLNGIMERPDWRVLARDLPLGIIPCGSGNGLAKSIAHLYNEPYEPKPIVNASLTCVSGHSAPLDVVRVELASKQNQTEMFSFLSVGWGLIADIDIESERWRSIGSQRFTLWALHRVLHLRTYKGKLSYLPWSKEKAQQQQQQPPRPPKTNSSSILRRFHDALDDEHDFVDAREADGEENEEFADIVSRSTFHPDSWHSAASKATAYFSIAGHSVRSNRSVGTMQSRIEAANAEYNTKAPQSNIPPINTPLPVEWVSEEGEYIMVHAGYTTHLGSDCYFVPESKLNDGIIYLVIIRAGVSKSQVLQFLLNLSSGTHLTEAPTTYVQVLPVTAFRIEPQDDDGIITVDGERVGYGTLQAEIFPGMIKVMVPNFPSDDNETSSSDS